MRDSASAMVEHSAAAYPAASRAAAIVRRESASLSAINTVERLRSDTVISWEAEEF